MIEEQRVIDFHGHTGRLDLYNGVDDPDLILRAMDKVGSTSLAFSTYFTQTAQPGMTSRPGLWRSIRTALSGSRTCRR